MPPACLLSVLILMSKIYAAIAARITCICATVYLRQSKLFTLFKRKLENGSSASRFILLVFAGQTVENTFHTVRLPRLKVWVLCATNLCRIHTATPGGLDLTISGVTRYFDYESAVTLRNLATTYGTDMQRYLLAPEVTVLLSKVIDLCKRLLINALCNTGARLNQFLQITKDDCVLDSPFTGACVRSGSSSASFFYAGHTGATIIRF